MLSPSWSTKAIFFGLLLAIEFLSVSTLAQSNPVPFVNQPLVPDAAKPGSQDIILTVNGTGFVQGSTVNWNNSPLVTKFVSGSQLTADVPSADIAVPSTASVTVASPSPGGGISNVAFFSVRTPFPAVSFDRTPLISGASPVAVITADLNSDGKLDLIVLNGTNSRVSVLLGNGDGTFQTRTNYPTTEAPVALVTGDFNGDGKVDLAISNLGGFGTISIFLGNGDGTFQPHRDFTINDQGIVLVTGDFNRDGKLDLAVSLRLSGQLGILLGNGDGTFSGPSDFKAVSGFASGLTGGDFDGDGILDLAETGLSGSDSVVAVFHGNGDGSFATPVAYATAPDPRYVLTADFNGDGKLDLAIQAIGGGGIGPQVSLLLGNGDGTFGGHLDSPAGPGSLGIADADLNADCRLDLILPSFSSQTVSTFLGKGDGTLRLENLFGTGKLPSSIATGDFNDDGKMDIVAANDGENTLSLMLQTTAVLSRTFLDFGVIKVGKSSTIPVKFTNIGSKVFAITGITLTGAKASQFEESSNCGSRLLPGASCTISVTFRPQGTGKITGVKVKVADSAVQVLQIIYLQGVGAS